MAIVTNADPHREACHAEATRLQQLLVGVPIGMRRPVAALQALRGSPLLEAGRADSTGIEGVPTMPALATPAAVLARRPSAERTLDARRTSGRILNLGI